MLFQFRYTSHCNDLSFYQIFNIIYNNRMFNHLNARIFGRKFHTIMLASRLLEASCFTVGLNARAVTVSRCPRKWRSNVGSWLDMLLFTKQFKLLLIQT